MVKDFKLADLATLREAASLFEQKKYAEAAARYVTISEKFPQSTYRPSAVLAAGNCYYLLGNLETAEKWLKAALPSGGEVGAGGALAGTRISEAKQAGRGSADGRPGNAGGEGDELRGVAAVGSGRRRLRHRRPARRVDRLYAALAKEHPQHAVAPQALYMAAFAALSQSDYRAAQTSCDRFFEAYPKSPLMVDVKAVAAEADLQLKAYARAEDAIASCWKKIRSMLMQTSGKSAGPWRFRWRRNPPRSWPR